MLMRKKSVFRLFKKGKKNAKCKQQYKMVYTCVFQTSENRREKSMTFNRFQIFFLTFL